MMAEVDQKISLLIADRQPLYRSGVRTALEKAGLFMILGEVGSSEELFLFMNNAQPDVLLLAADLSEQDGLALARSVKQLHPGVSVILVTSHPTDEELFDAIKYCAAGYLPRDVASSELLETVKKAGRGQHPINDTVIARPRVAARLLQQFQDLSWGRGLDNLVTDLTARETEVLKYLAKGMTNKKMAAILNISEQTMKNHVTSILRKLNANARTEAVIIAIKRGLIKLD